MSPSPVAALVKAERRSTCSAEKALSADLDKEMKHKELKAFFSFMEPRTGASSASATFAARKAPSAVVCVPTRSSSAAGASKSTAAARPLEKGFYD